ncbi:PASTA domain-containing protein [Streptomyces sp. NPDC050658]|uniref:PASTA domain-containing protein n=1 Tax=unclassified Streptomyces TaxID=2593676 RepID=UPI00343BECBA
MARKDTLLIGAALGGCLACLVLVPVAVSRSGVAEQRGRAMAEAAAAHKAELKQAKKAAYDEGFAAGDPGTVDLPDFSGDTLLVAKDAAEALGHDTTDEWPKGVGSVGDGSAEVCSQEVDKGTGTVTFFAVPSYLKNCPKGFSAAARMPKMPKLTGVTYDKAQDALHDGLGVEAHSFEADIKSAYEDDEVTSDDVGGYEGDYTVCFQSPAAGAASKGPDTSVTVWLTSEGKCPKKKGGYFDPANDPDAPEPITDGTYMVGEDIDPGTYKTDGGGNCYWERLSGTGGDLGDIIANDLPSGSSYVTIAPSDKAFSSTGCGTWTKTG